MLEFANCRFDIRSQDEDSPIGRWGHTSCVLKDEILFFGGEAEECTEMNGIEPLLVLNVNNYSFNQIFVPGGPRSRDSHICVVVKDKLFVWGGCHNKQPCSDCYSFSAGAWKLINQKGRVPLARQSQTAGVLNNRYIVMYGGCRDHQIFNDFHLFDTDDSTWYALNRLTGDPFQLREGSTMSIVKGSVIYIFGGRNDKEKYCNNLSKATLQNYQLEKRAPPPQLIVEQLKPKGRLPRQRSDHSAVVFEGRYIIVLGGVIEVQTAGNKPKMELLNDIWAFNLEANEWEQLQPQNNHLFKSRCNFSAVLYEDDIIIFGGMTGDPKNPNHSDLVTLSLEPASKRLTDRPYEFCGGCQSIFSQRKPEEANSMVVTRAVSTFKIDALSLRSMAMLIGHPFRALELILDDLVARRAHQVKFLCFSKNDHRYIRIVSSGSIPYFDFEVQNALCSFGLVYDCSTADTTNRNMKLACLRLSQSFVLINTYGQEQSVALFAKGDIHYYEVNLKTGDVRNCTGPNTLVHIKEHISPYCFESKFQEGTQQIILLDPPKELVFAPDDIQFQRGVTVPSANKQLDSWESSLSSCIAVHFFEQLPLRVIVQSRIVEFAKMNEIPAAVEKGTEAIVDCSRLPEGALVWRPDAPVNFIGYYRGNKLLGWYTGRLKHEYTGYVVVPEEVPVNMFGNGFRSALERQQMELLLQSVLEQHNSEHRLKRAPMVSIEQFAEEAESSPLKRPHKEQ